VFFFFFFLKQKILRGENDFKPKTNTLGKGESLRSTPPQTGRQGGYFEKQNIYEGEHDLTPERIHVGSGDH